MRTNGNHHFWVSLAVLFFLLLAVELCQGQEAPADSALVFRAVGNMDLLQTEIGWRPGLAEDRTEIGLWGTWLDGVRETELEAYGGGVYGSYDLVTDATLKLLSVQVPTTWSLGTQLGILKPDTGGPDATAALWTGLSFGDKKIRLGIRGTYFLTQDLWRELADIPDEARLLATIAFRF